MVNGEVIHLRLINADEIIGELDKIEDEKIYLRKPMIVDEREDPKSKTVSIVLTRYLLCDKSISIPFRSEHIITQTGVLPEISEFYFNSLEYNERFMEPQILSDIEKTNTAMREFLEEDSEVLANKILNVLDQLEGTKETKDDLRIVMVPSSNTIH